MKLSVFSNRCGECAFQIDGIQKICYRLGQLVRNVAFVRGVKQLV